VLRAIVVSAALRLSRLLSVFRKLARIPRFNRFNEQLFLSKLHLRAGRRDIYGRFCFPL